MQPLQQPKPLKQTAYEYIKENIVAGAWAGGTFISEKELTESLGMSKTPIRAALDRLEMMGLVQLFPKQGAVVTELSLKKILEIYELRKALETYAAKQLTGKLDDLFFTGMDSNIDLQAHAIKNGDITEYVKQDRQFHAMIVAGLDNEEYSNAIHRIHDQFLLVVRATFLKNNQRLLGSIEEHRQIRRALSGDDPLATERLMIQHLDYVMRIML